MRIYRPLLVTLALLAALIAAPATQAAGSGKYAAKSHPKPADGLTVTQKNLLESERFWPYHVALIEAWTPKGVARPLAKGTRGVLIRVEASGLARIDFGRDGLYEVPVAKTDLVAQANRIREGTGEEKDFANFLLAIGPRMVDPATMIAPGPARLTHVRFFVCVYADPGAADFGEIAQALAPLSDHEVANVLFPQGEQTDAELGKLLRAAGWKGLYVYASMAREYTRTLLPDAAAPPQLQLTTSEGRVLFAGPWGATSVEKLGAALAANPSSPTPASSSAGPAHGSGSHP